MQTFRMGETLTHSVSSKSGICLISSCPFAVASLADSKLVISHAKVCIVSIAAILSKPFPAGRDCCRPL